MKDSNDIFKAKRRLDQARRRKKWADANRETKAPRRIVKILWPGCADPERVSMTAYTNWARAGEIIPGTNVWIDGKPVAIQERLFK